VVKPKVAVNEQKNNKRLPDAGKKGLTGITGK
jgi:hypothetical protein